MGKGAACRLATPTRPPWPGVEGLGFFTGSSWRVRAGPRRRGTGGLQVPALPFLQNLPTSGWFRAARCWESLQPGLSSQPCCLQTRYPWASSPPRCASGCPSVRRGGPAAQLVALWGRIRVIHGRCLEEDLAHRRARQVLAALLSQLSQLPPPLWLLCGDSPFSCTPLSVCNLVLPCAQCRCSFRAPPSKLSGTPQLQRHSGCPVFVRQACLAERLPCWHSPRVTASLFVKPRLPRRFVSLQTFFSANV